jgi:diaminopimelate epimerase
MILSTSIGEVPAVVAGGHVRLTLPPPQDQGEIELTAGALSFRGRRVLAGVPHVVLPVTGLSSFPVDRVGAELRRHAVLGPAGANVNFVEDGADGRVHVRTFERGVERETLSCGTGAVAVALAARLAGAPETVVVVPYSGLALTVVLDGHPRTPVNARLSGDARVVFEGVLADEAIAGTG